jgi:hypothetical protein
LEEWHITVDADPVRWHHFCGIIGVKPLYIELSTFERQLMCASKHNPADDIMRQGRNFLGQAQIIRIKHEVAALALGEQSVYYECHVKLDGPFDPDAEQMVSRDLYRKDRWYITKRSLSPFSAQEFVDDVRTFAIDAKHVVIAGWEYEAALIDTNPGLDARWVRR